MKLGKFAAVGAAAAALLMAGNANALTWIATASNTPSADGLAGTTQLIVSSSSNNEFTLEIKNYADTWSGAANLVAFAFNGNIIGTTGTLTASETSPGSVVGAEQSGGLNAKGCDGSGFGTGGFCFGFTGAGVSSDMIFKIDTTGSFDYSNTNLPDLKINFQTAGNKNAGTLFSDSVPFCNTDACNTVTTGGGGGGVPEPATWAMMLVGFGALGGALRARRKMALATA